MARENAPFEGCLAFPDKLQTILVVVLMNTGNTRRIPGTFDINLIASSRNCRREMPLISGNEEDPPRSFSLRRSRLILRKNRDK